MHSVILNLLPTVCVSPQSSGTLPQQMGSCDSALVAAQTLAAAAGMTPEGYVMVDKDDAVGALAWYIATVLAKLPEAQALPPAELQAALIATLQVSDGKLQFRGHTCQLHRCLLGRKLMHVQASRHHQRPVRNRPDSLLQEPYMQFVVYQ